MTDYGTGRTGFAFGDGGGPGGRSMRISGTHERYPVEKGEALTAGSLWYKLYSENFPKVKKDHADYEIWTRQASLVFSTPPLWDDEGGSIDLFYWYFGSLAMNAWGGSAWKGWDKSLEQALIPNQRVSKSDSGVHGSWDPIGAWGSIGGRVYSTAMATLALQASYRYQF